MNKSWSGCLFIDIFNIGGKLTILDGSRNCFFKRKGRFLTVKENPFFHILEEEYMNENMHEWMAREITALDNAIWLMLIACLCVVALAAIFRKKC